jgi:hypothetical protein
MKEPNSMIVFYIGPLPTDNILRDTKNIIMYIMLRIIQNNLQR